MQTIYAVWPRYDFIELDEERPFGNEIERPAIKSINYFSSLPRAQKYVQNQCDVLNGFGQVEKNRKYTIQPECWYIVACNLYE